MRKRRPARTAAAVPVVPTPLIPPRIPQPRTSATHVTINHHYPTLQDVSQVRKLLGFVPSRLVDEVLQQAECWPRLISHVGEEVRVRARLPYEDVWRVYLASRAIPSVGPDGSAVRIERMRFELESHDQGWDGAAMRVLPYAGAWSQFSAVVLSEAESHRLQDPVLPSDIKEIQDRDRRVYTVQCNRRADRTKRIHEVVWNRGECRLQKMDEDGAGNGF
ncbi:hypothetical protein AX16_007911 [Volvariella volvacea WC 439]|nr:hypothetical protein AX16_007911 [Volvariella volvacea WC 439]